MRPDVAVFAERHAMRAEQYVEHDAGQRVLEHRTGRTERRIVVVAR